MLYCGVGLHVMEVVTTYGPERLTVFLKVSDAPHFKVIILV